MWIDRSTCGIEKQNEGNGDDEATTWCKLNLNLSKASLEKLLSFMTLRPLKKPRDLLHRKMPLTEYSFEVTLCNLLTYVFNTHNLLPSAATCEASGDPPARFSCQLPSPTTWFARNQRPPTAECTLRIQSFIQIGAGSFERSVPDTLTNGRTNNVLYY